MANLKGQAAQDGRNPSAARSAVPPAQHNFEDAAKKALAVVRGQPAEQLEWLGASRVGDCQVIPVLDDIFTVELEGGTVRCSGGRVVGSAWRILLLHYLSVSGRPMEMEPAVSFAELPGGRTYDIVYRQRVIERLCRTVGRDKEQLGQAGRAIGATQASVGDLGLDFKAFPRIRIRLVWYAGDEELPPDATLLFPANIGMFMEVEDIVVTAEQIVSRLRGKPW